MSFCSATTLYVIFFASGSHDVGDIPSSAIGIGPIPVGGVGDNG
jgi:hypothetical protein